MSVKEEVTLALESLSDAQLQEVAEYIAFLKSRPKTSKENRQLREDGAAVYRQPSKGVIRRLLRFFGSIDR